MYRSGWVHSAAFTTGRMPYGTHPFLNGYHARRA